MRILGLTVSIRALGRLRLTVPVERRAAFLLIRQKKSLSRNPSGVSAFLHTPLETRRGKRERKNTHKDFLNKITNTLHHSEAGTARMSVHNISYNCKEN